MADAFNPGQMKHPFGVFSHAAWQPAGRVLHISGQVAIDGDGNIVGAGDMAAQTRQTLRNIGIVLDAAGGRFDDIVSVIVYVTDMGGLDAIHEVRREFFAEPYPASTLVQVTALVDPEMLIEISAVVVIPGDRAKGRD